MQFKKFPFLLLFFFMGISAWAMGDLSSESKSPLIGQTAPDAVLTNTNGGFGSVLAARQGKQAILVFWATWCPHCYEELGTLNDNLASIEKKGIKIILIDVGEAKEDVKNYFLRRQMRLNSFLDTDDSLQAPYHLIGVPTVVFIDEKGIVRSVSHTFPSNL